jgi:hypothetical protein
MLNKAQYPDQIFDGYTTGNTDRDERNDDVQPDFHDYDQLAAELISIETTLNNSATTYLPTPAPANGASYIVDVDANGVISWLRNYLPTSAPANGAIYNLDVDANGVVSWVVDANG